MTAKGDHNVKVLWYLLILFVISIPLSIIMMNRETRNVFEEYPLLKSNESLNSVVLDYKDYKSTTLIVFKDSTFKSVRAYNWTLKKSALYLHLENGDSISYEPNSKNLTLFKKNTGDVIDFEVDYLE